MVRKRVRAPISRLKVLMPWQSSRVSYALIGVALAAATVLAAWWLPLATQEHTAVALKHADDTLLLNSGQTIQQKFYADGGYQSGIVLYATAPLWDNRQLDVRLLDATGHELAHGRHVTASYINDDTLRLSIATTWFKTQPKDHITAQITLHKGALLPLKLIKAATRQDIALGILYPTRLSFGARQGVLVGVFIMLAVIAITLLVPPRHHWLAVGLLLIIGSLLGLGGFWFSSDQLGIADWDYYFSLHHIYRQTILHYHQVPLWNPYTCGGTAALADPEFPIFTPTFLLELLFGIPIGLRLAIYLATIGGGLGMLALAKRMRLSVWASCLAAIGYMFSTVNLLEIVEGHVNILAAMWLPWLWWAWLGAYQAKTISPRRLLPLAIFFALTFLQGGLYLLLYTLLALLVVIAFAPRKKHALILTLLAGAWSLALVAIKLVPVLLWLRQFPDQTYASSAFTLPWLTDILFGRYLHGTYLVFRQASGWHEYGAYVGLSLFALSLLGLTQLRQRRAVAILVVGAVSALLLSTLGPTLKPWFDSMPWLPRSNISRVILLTVIALTLLAGFGLDWLRRHFKTPLPTALLIGIVAIDLLSLAYPLSQQAFVLPPVVPAISPPPSPLAYTTRTFDYRAPDLHQTRDYEATKAGWGTFAYCSVLGPTKRAVTPIESEYDAHLVTTEPSTTLAAVSKWSPNHLTVEVETTTDTLVMINTNYAAGWHVNGQPAQEHAGRLATNVPPGRHRLSFTYRAPGFTSGAVITALTILLTLLLIRRSPPVADESASEYTAVI